MENLTQPTTQLPVLQTILKVEYSKIFVFAAWLKDNTDNYLIGEHPPGIKNGIHCHILIEGLKVSREALRKQVIKYSPGKGQNCTMANTQEGNKPYDRNLLATYIIKGNVGYVKHSSFPEVMLIEWANKWEQRTITKLNTQELIVKKSKPTIYEDCNEILDTLGGFKTDSSKDRTEIVRAIITWANLKRKALHSVQVMNYYDIILGQAIPEYYNKLCCDLINRRHRD